MSTENNQTQTIMMNNIVETKENSNNVGFALDFSVEPKSVLEYGYRVLNTNETTEKVKLTLAAYQAFKQGTLPIGLKSENISLIHPPIKPQRPVALTTIDPALIPSKQKANQDYNRFRLIHSLAHIESYAIDLSWDILVRWAATGADSGVEMPEEFYADWLR